jgi:hypothetical protein
VSERNCASATPTTRRCNQRGCTHDACTDHACARACKEAVEKRNEDEGPATTAGRQTSERAVSNRHGDGDIPSGECNHMPKTSGGEGVGKSLIHSFPQPHDDGSGEPTSRCRDDAL